MRKTGKNKNFMHVSTPAGFEPALPKEIDSLFLGREVLVNRLNHSAKVSWLMV